MESERAIEEAKFLLEAKEEEKRFLLIPAEESGVISLSKQEALVLAQMLTEQSRSW